MAVGLQLEHSLQGKAAELRRRLGIARRDGYILCSERAGRLWRQEVAPCMSEVVMKGQADSAHSVA